MKVNRKQNTSKKEQGGQTLPFLFGVMKDNRKANYITLVFYYLL
jgi:hypothetical protein